MRTRPKQANWRLARCAALACLLVAMALHGLLSSISDLLGANHFHNAQAVVLAGAKSAGASNAMDGWQDFRRVNHASDSAVRHHEHSILGRHHHASDDSTVVKVGEGTSEERAADGVVPAAAAFVFVVAAGVVVAPSVQHPTAADWSGLRVDRIRSCHARRLERPPNPQRVG